MSTITDDFLSHHREILTEFSNARLNFTNQEHDFKEWSTRCSIALGSGSPLRSPTHTAQNMSVDCLNPAAIEVELKDFKELFSKLKVTYLEQETKETFLHIILDDNDDEAGTENGDSNARKDLRIWRIKQKDLDEATQRNAGLKQVLVDKKKALQDASDEITALVGEVCDKYEILKTEVSQAENMLQEIESMQAEVRELERSEDEAETEGHQALSLKETQDLYGNLTTQDLELDGDIHELKEVIIPGKRRELENLTAELGRLSELSKRLEEAATLAVEERQMGMKQGKTVAKENIGRWYSNVIYILKSLLYIDKVHVDRVSEQVTLSFKNSKERTFEVKLSFNNGRFYNAAMINPSTLHISRVVDIAVKYNDVRYFIEELKMIVEQ
ncbi:hypothetical protein V1517DRAFT_283216 [Lipomyces orientalis]|uniref:Uncharacterized protein n=1 Tax=Lipomyces orientalis TaxID=1233043 RepID=A0ACC3U093_9ASCO